MMTSTSRTALLRPAPVAWTTVVVLALLMAYADGFVVTALEGAVGVAQHERRPFVTWLQSSTLMLPVFVLAVLAALAVARSRLGPDLRAPWRVVAAGLMIAVAGGLAGTAEVVVTAVSAYDLQSERLAATASTHAHVASGAPEPSTGPCTGTCAAQQAQREVLGDAARLGSAAVLGADVVLVGWFLAFRGGRL